MSCAGAIRYYPSSDPTACYTCRVLSPLHFLESAMSEHVYKMIELVGSSPNSTDDAIRNAIARAGKTLRNLDWFEVLETRGQLVDGKVAHFQVTLKVGIRLED